MNYTCAAVGIIMAIAAVTWITVGKGRFRGPVSGGVVIGGDQGVDVSVEERDEDGVGQHAGKDA